MKKHLSGSAWVFILFVVLNLVLHAQVALQPQDTLLNWYLTDDAFYYFKTAQNVAEGRGITYDGLAPTNGFHPLWMAICVPLFALARFDLYLPLRLLVILQALLNAASGYLLFRLASRHIHPLAGWLAAAFWMFLPPIHAMTTKLGMETGITVFSAFLLLDQVAGLPEGGLSWKQNWHAILKVSAAALILLMSRLDAIFLVALLGVWLVLRGSQMGWMAMLDFLLIAVSALAAYFWRIQDTGNLFNFQPFFNLLVGLSLVLKPLALYAFGCYDGGKPAPLRQVLLRVLIALTLASLLIAGLVFLLFEGLHLFRGYSRAVLLLDWLLALLLMGGLHVLVAWRSDPESDAFVDISFSKNWRAWFSTALGYFLPLIGGLALYMAANHAYAGTWMPVSGQIKRWWGKLPNTVYGRPLTRLPQVAAGIFDPDPETGPFWLLTRPLHLAASELTRAFNLGQGVHPFMLALLWVLLAALVIVVLHGRFRAFGRLAARLALLPLFVGLVLHALSYKATGYLGVKDWYWVTEMVWLTLLFTALAGFLLAQVDELYSRRLTTVAVGVISIALLAGFAATIQRDFPLDGSAAPMYNIEGDRRFLEAHTSKGDVIGMTGGGLNAYFMPERTFMNLDGLINSEEYFHALQAGSAQEFLAAKGVNYIYGEDLVLLDSDPYRWIFTDRLDFVAQGSYFRLFRYCYPLCP